MVLILPEGMNLGTLAWRNAGRSKLRTIMTVSSVAVTLVAFLVLRSVNAAWTRQVDETPNNRVVARHKVGWDQQLPVHYVEEVRQMPGIRHVMGAHWLALYDPRMKEEWLESTAVHAKVFIAMHYELEAPAEQKEAFLADRRGAFISKQLSQKHGWSLGSTIHLKGPEPVSEWEFTVRGIYESSRHGFAQRALWFHYEYLNERMPLEDRNRIGLIAAEIVDPAQGAELARHIDAYFDEQDDQTFTQEDQALNASFVGMFGALLHAIDIVSVLVLGIVVLVVGNTVAMAARERVQEHGALRAMGFSPNRLAFLICGEAIVLGGLGGVAGVALAVPVINTFVGRYLEETMELAQVQVPWSWALFCVAAACVLGAVAALLPAYRTRKLQVSQAMRDIG